jgi:hypothetical protein
MLALIINNVNHGTSRKEVNANTTANQHQHQQQQDENSDDVTRPKQQEMSALLLSLESDDPRCIDSSVGSLLPSATADDKGRRRQQQHNSDEKDDTMFLLSSSSLNTKRANQQKQKCWYYYWKDQLITCLRRLLKEINPFTHAWFSFVDHHPQKYILDIPSTFVPSSTAALVVYFEQLEKEQPKKYKSQLHQMSKRRQRRRKLDQQHHHTRLKTEDEGEHQAVDEDTDDDTSTDSGSNSSQSSDDNTMSNGSCLLCPRDSFHACSTSENNVNHSTYEDEEIALEDTITVSSFQTGDDTATHRMTERRQKYHEVIKQHWPKLLRRRVLIILWKVLLFCTTINTIVLGVLNVSRPSFYLAYLTHWSMTFCGLYVTVNLFNCYYYNTIQQPSTTDTANTNVPFLIKVTWFLFQLASHTAAGAAFVFWPIRNVMDMPLSYNLVMNHGGIVTLVLLDGMYVNRIPYRIVHWYTMIVPIQILYVVWSLIHDFLTDIGNPDRYHPDDPFSNDDALYPVVLEWSTEKWRIALLTSCSILFLLSPGIVLGFWYLSIYPLPLSENFGNVSYTRLRYYSCSHNDHDMIPNPQGAIYNRRVVQQGDDEKCYVVPQLGQRLFKTKNVSIATTGTSEADNRMEISRTDTLSLSSSSSASEQEDVDEIH